MWNVYFVDNHWRWKPVVTFNSKSIRNRSYTSSCTSLPRRGRSHMAGVGDFRDADLSCLVFLWHTVISFPPLKSSSGPTSFALTRLVGWLGSFDTNRDTHTITTVMRSTTSVDRIDFPLISWTRSITSIQALVGGSPLIYPSHPPAGHPAVLLGYWVCLSQCGESIKMLHFWYNRSAHESGEISVSVAASEIVRNTL